MVYALIGKGLCHLGTHDRDEREWKYSQSSQLDYPVSAPRLRDFLNSVCRQEGVCRRCGAKSNRTHHNWAWGTDLDYTNWVRTGIHPPGRVPQHNGHHCLRCGAEKPVE